MAIYKRLEQLEGKILVERDRVVFRGITYLVIANALSHYFHHECGHLECNDKIFIVLGITDKYSFCSKHFRYPAGGDPSILGQFPTSKEGDYSALTRVAIELFKLCEN